MRSIAVTLLEEREVLRRGMVACLAEDPLITVVEDDADNIDVAVVSEAVARGRPPPYPMVVCHGPAPPAPDSFPNAFGFLRRDSLTAAQLIGAVRAAAAGLRFEAASADGDGLGGRSRDILRMLAEGAGTDEIAAALGCSPRTVKSDLARARRVLGARSRTQAVAEAVRRSLI